MAVVRFQSYRQAQLGGVDRSGEFVVVDTWVKDGDTWRLSMRLLTRPDLGVGARSKDPSPIAPPAIATLRALPWNVDP